MILWAIVLPTIFVLYLLLQVGYIFISFGKAKEFRLPPREQKISVLIPSYNEALVVSQCIEGWKKLIYDNKEAIFINDGSTDDTMDVLHELLDLHELKQEVNLIIPNSNITNIFRSTRYPEIYVVNKINGGKSDALNTGISLATGKIVVTLDADSILERDSLLRINEAFTDPKVIAAGGMVHVGQLINRRGLITYGKSMLLRFQLSGYLSSFYVRKYTQSKLNVLGVVSGAFGAFRRNVLIDIGGYKKTLGEDMEITFRLQKYIYSRKMSEKMVFVPTAVCYTEVPESFQSLLQQRIRWQKGFIDCLNLYKKDLLIGFSNKFTFFLLFESIILSFLGIITLMVMPISLLLGHITPLTICLLAMAWSSEFILRLVAVWHTNSYGYFFSWKSWLGIILFTVWESISYRLLDSFFFLYGTILYVFGNQTNWNKLQRSGSVIPNELQPLEKNIA